jgi:hypothetical protein
MATAEITPLSLGDLFDRAFRLLARTFSRSFPLALIALVPPGLLLMAGLDAFYTILGSLFQSTMLGIQPGEEASGEITWTAVMSGLAGFAVLAGTVFARVGITCITCAEMLGKRIPFREAISMAAGFRYTRAIGQVVLEYLALGAALGGGYVLLIGSFITKSAILVLGGILVFLAAGALVVYLAVRWSQTYAVIAWEGTGALAAFSRSSYLVETGWWRVFGILVLFGFLKEFAVGLLTTPVSLFALWDFYRGYFSLLGSADAATAGPALMADMFSSVGIGMGLTVLCSIVLGSVLVPAYSTALYVDLRARHGEFAAQGSPPPSGPVLDLLDDIRFDGPGADLRPV